LPPVCTARILAIGTLRDPSCFILIALILDYFVRRNIASEKLSHSVLLSFPSNRVVRVFQSSIVDSPLRNRKRIFLKLCCS
jgi:hypothetical protein